MTKWKKKGLLSWCGAGLAAAAVITALICLAIAAAMNQGLIPMGWGQESATAAAGVSVLLVTAVIVQVRGRQYLTTGAALGGGYGIVCALLCALSGAEAVFGLWLVWLFCATVGGGLLGAIMSIGKNPHTRRRK